MKRKMSKTRRFNLSNSLHWQLCCKHNQIYLNTVNEADRNRERVNFYYHNAVYNAQMDCKRILTKTEKRQIYADVKSQLNQSNKR